MRLYKQIIPILLLLTMHSMVLAQYKDIAWIQWPSALPVNRVCFSPTSQYVAFESNDYKVTIWEAATVNMILPIADSTSTSNYSWPMYFSADGKGLVKASYGSIKIWGIPYGDLLKQIDASNVSALSPDSRFFASTVYQNGYNVDLYTFPTGDSIRRLQLGAVYLQTLSFSPHGSMIATGQQDGTIRLFHTTTADTLPPIQAHAAGTYGSTIGAISFSPDERYMASGGGDRIIKLWDVATGQLVRRMFGHTDWITALDFSSDGKFLASASADGTVRLWNVTTGENVYTYDEYPGIQYTIAFSPNMRYIASGTQDGAAIIWNAKYSRISDVDDRTGKNASDLLLDQNQPNPFNGSTTINFSIPKSSHVTLEVFNLYGQRVATLLDEQIETGSHEAVWNGSDQPAGWYYYRLTTGASSVMRSMLLQR